MPAATGASAAVLLGVATWLTSDVWDSPESTAHTSAAAAPRSTSVQATTTTTPSPTTTTTTTTTTTRATTSKKPPAPKTTKAKPPPTTTKPPAPAVKECSSTLEGTQPHVARVGNHILSKFQVDSVGGRASRSGTSDHPSGLALDFMVDTATGNALADYVLANRKAFGVSYVIWRQRYNDGGGWSTMEDRGSVTANHYDHVHVSFHADADVSVTC